MTLGGAAFAILVGAGVSALLAMAHGAVAYWGLASVVCGALAAAIGAVVWASPRRPTRLTKGEA